MENLNMVVGAIEQVKDQIKEAALAGNLQRYRELMGNLLALENCLLTEAKKLLKSA